MGLMKKMTKIVATAWVAVLLAALMSAAGASEPVAGIEKGTAAAEGAGAAVDLSTSNGVLQEKQAAEPEPELSLPGIRLLNITHSYFSKNIEGLSDAVDSFFGSDRIFEEISGTYVQFRGSVIFGKSGERRFDGRVRAKINLDNLNNRVQLQLYGEDEAAEPGTVLDGEEFSDTFKDLEPAASLQFVLLEQRRWDIRLRPGLKFRSPLDPFVKVRFRRQQRIGARWLWRTTLYPSWYDSRGYEFPVTLDVERGTGGGGLFRSSSSGVWREEDSANLYLQEALMFSHPFGRRNQLA